MNKTSRRISCAKLILSYCEEGNKMPIESSRSKQIWPTYFIARNIFEIKNPWSLTVSLLQEQESPNPTTAKCVENSWQHPSVCGDMPVYIGSQHSFASFARKFSIPKPLWIDIFYYIHKVLNTSAQSAMKFLLLHTMFGDIYLVYTGVRKNSPATCVKQHSVGKRPWKPIFMNIPEFPNFCALDVAKVIDTNKAFKNISVVNLL